MKKPFNVSTPAAPAAPAPRKALNPADARDKASAEGITLHEAGAEVMVPDGDAGPLSEAASQDGGRPVYAPAIPWPAAKTGHKPFKI